MNIWIALLRGINVGGANLLNMRDLVALLDAIGCTNPKTYIQSGNVVFRSDEDCSSMMADRISDAVAQKQGFRPQVLVISREELQKAADQNPFPEAHPEPSTVHLFFLAGQPPQPDIDGLTRLKAQSESFLLGDKVFYLHAPAGIGRSRLAARAEKLIGVDATARNYRTVSKLLELASQF